MKAIPVNCPPENIEKLWRAVLASAIADLKLLDSEKISKEDKYASIRAYIFLAGITEQSAHHLEVVCAMAGASMQKIKRQASRYEWDYNVAISNYDKTVSKKYAKTKIQA